MFGSLNKAESPQTRQQLRGTEVSLWRFELNAIDRVLMFSSYDDVVVFEKSV